MPRTPARHESQFQVGHCSQAVGAAQVAQTVKGSLSDDAYVVIAGCDGACFDAPQIIVTEPFGEQRRFARVTPDDVPRFIRSSESGNAVSDDFFAGQRRITLHQCGELDSTDIDDYIVHGGYAGLGQALAMPPEEVIEEVKASGPSGKRGCVLSCCAKVAGCSRCGYYAPLSGGQLRGRGTGRLQGPASHGGRSPSSD